MRWFAWHSQWEFYSPLSKIATRSELEAWVGFGSTRLKQFHNKILLMDTIYRRFLK